MKHKLIILYLLLASSFARSQHAIDSILAAVERNNRTIQSQVHYREAQELAYRTGLNPDDPMIGADYMVGSPAGAGNQLDLTVTQSFDFPTVYSNRRELAEVQTGQSEYAIRAVRQEVLLEARLVCFRLIYLNKWNNLLRQRLQHAERIYNDYNARLSAGEGQVLDVNKARLNLVRLQTSLRLNDGERQAWSQKLTELNGGINITLTDTLYPVMAALPSFEVLDSLVETSDPMLKLLEQQSLIVEQEIELNKSLWLPGFEAGYHYQAILGQTYNGAHVGLSIPLWENRNRVEQKETELLYTQSQVEEHRTAHLSEIRQWYEKYLALKAGYEDYMQLVAGLTSADVLEKALQGGEISTLEFFQELAASYAAYDELLEIEVEYFSVMAQLNKYLF